jgi:hypothetical protein
MQLSLLLSFLILTIASAGKINGPVKAIYVDFAGFNWNHPSYTVKDMADAGFNLIILAFKVGLGAADMAQAFAGEPDDLKKAAIEYAHSKGAKVMISAGGATDTPYSNTAVDYAKSAAEFAQKNYLDGVDFDMENLQPGFKATGKTSDETIQWLVDASNTVRKILGDDAIITHAPQAPYFGKIGGGAGTNPWTQTSGGYTAVYKQASHIDYFLTQFYNQGATCYTDYKGLFENSSDCPDFPGTSVKEIAAYGIPLEKIVVGKPVRQQDASNGQMTATQINSIFKQARLMGYNTGVMGWMWYGAEAGQWIQTIYPNSTNTPIITPQATAAPVTPQQNKTNVTVAAAPEQNKTNTTITVTKPQEIKTNTTVAAAAAPEQKPSVTPTPTIAAAPAQGKVICISADLSKATDAWCKFTSCNNNYIKSGLCKLVQLN